MTTRINPDTGIIERDESVFGGVFGYDWEPAPNADDIVERINPDTGVLEEDTSIFGGLFGYDFYPKK